MRLLVVEKRERNQTTTHGKERHCELCCERDAPLAMVSHLELFVPPKFYDAANIGDVLEIVNHGQAQKDES